MKSIYLIPIFALLLTSCTGNEYTPKGEFYVKTSTSSGDAGVTNVVTAEIEKASYQGNEDIVVSTTVGFGHLPQYSSEDESTFYIHCFIEELPKEDDNLLWETKVIHDDCFHSEKYNSTEQKNSSFLVIPIYGNFYPEYTEVVDFVYPAKAVNGRVTIKIVIVDGENEYTCHGGGSTLEFYYAREGNKLSFSK